MGQCDSGLAARTPLPAREGSSMTDVMHFYEEYFNEF